MHTGARTDLNRELMGQGSANIVSGMLGGLPLPVTGVIVRSATNVEAGARTRKSAVLHGLWILGEVENRPLSPAKSYENRARERPPGTGLMVHRPSLLLQVAPTTKDSMGR